MTRIGCISLGLAVVLAAAAHAEDGFWARKPSVGDFANYYPEKAVSDKRAGDVEMSCRVAPDRTLADCRVEREAPQRYDFGAAAMAMAHLFQMAEAHPGEDRVLVHIEFSYPGGSAFLALRPVEAPGGGVAPVDRISRPQWLSRPSPDDVAGATPVDAANQGVTGRATVECRVDTAGALADCHAVSEDPPGMGFADAALRLSRQFRMAQTDGEGRPVAGRLIAVPMRIGAPAAH